MAGHSDMKKALTEMVAKCNNEQAELQKLNERFASYIAKIRSLEQQNQTLEVELKQLRSHESKRVTELYDKEISDLRNEVKTQMEHSSNFELELKDTKESLQKAIHEKEEAFKKLASLKKDLDAPSLASQALKAQIKSLRDEIAFQKKIHEERTQEFQKLEIQFKEMKNNVQTDGANSDLMVVLQELKTQFQNTANTITKSETEEWYKKKISEMKETESVNNETLRKLSQDNTNLTNQSQKNLHKIDSLTAMIKEMGEDIQTLKETITVLKAEKNKIKDDMEESHKKKIQTLEETIRNLDADKNKMNDDKEIQLLEYQDLLKEKGTLEKEIAFYRTLLEQEERRTQRKTE